MEHPKSKPVAVNGKEAKSDEASVTNSTVESPAFCGGCLTRIRGWIPVDYKEEIGQILKLAGPVVINVTGISVGSGLASACDTLISQRGVLILLLACFPCWALLINTEPILLAVRQSPEVARGSAAANSISQFSLAVFLYCYIVCQGLHKATWEGSELRADVLTWPAHVEPGVSV
ncbi:unnamed protein product [Coregonus sp. 'balchen']|nr:unnamed protein product [Coregonus sp. 'balchen']